MKRVEANIKRTVWGAVEECQLPMRKRFYISGEAENEKYKPEICQVARHYF